MMADSTASEGRGEGEEGVDVVDAKRREVVEEPDPASMVFYTKVASRLATRAREVRLVEDTNQDTFLKGGGLVLQVVVYYSSIVTRGEA